MIFANSITYPISLLVEASEEVRKGNLKVKVNSKISDDNEIYLLVNSFNKMVKQLFDQRNDLVTANEQIDKRRRFIESVLTGVTSAVIGVSADDKIHLPNKAALELFGADASKLIGIKIDKVIPELKNYIKKIKYEKKDIITNQIEIFKKGKKRVLIFRIAKEMDKGIFTGYVITFEDITELIEIERAAAWSDIARRIAHEIKNPLTPIQLAADRIKRKYQNEIKNEKNIFISCIDTIIRQVGTIHRMINEFSSFARMPTARPEMVNINKLITGTRTIIALAHKEIKINYNIAKNTNVLAFVDGNLLNQALTNIIQNSINAIYAKKDKFQSSFNGLIEINLSIKDSNCIISVSDNGIGLPSKNKDDLMEPYVTSRVHTSHTSARFCQRRCPKLVTCDSTTPG